MMNPGNQDRCAVAPIFSKKRPRQALFAHPSNPSSNNAPNQQGLDPFSGMNRSHTETVGGHHQMKWVESSLGRKSLSSLGSKHVQTGKQSSWNNSATVFHESMPQNQTKRGLHHLQQQPMPQTFSFQPHFAERGANVQHLDSSMLQPGRHPAPRGTTQLASCPDSSTHQYGGRPQYPSPKQAQVPYGMSNTPQMATKPYGKPNTPQTVHQSYGMTITPNKTHQKYGTTGQQQINHHSNMTPNYPAHISHIYGRQPDLPQLDPQFYGEPRPQMDSRISTNSHHIGGQTAELMMNTKQDEGTNDFRLQKKAVADSSLHVLTASIQGMKHWSKYRNKMPIIFVIIAQVNSATSLNEESCAKEFILKDDKDSINCIFYQIDRQLPRLVRGQWYRCVGSLSPSKEAFHVVNIRQATETERRFTKVYIAAADRAMRAWVAKDCES